MKICSFSFDICVEISVQETFLIGCNNVAFSSWFSLQTGFDLANGHILRCKYMNGVIIYLCRLDSARTRELLIQSISVLLAISGSPSLAAQAEKVLSVYRKRVHSRVSTVSQTFGVNVK